MRVFCQAMLPQRLLNASGSLAAEPRGKIVLIAPSVRVRLARGPNRSECGLSGDFTVVLVAHGSYVYLPLW